MGKIDKLNTIAREVCNTYNVTYCFDKAYCCRRYKHLPFQREYNDNVTISSYVMGNYDFYDVEQIEEFIAFKGAFELASLLKNTDDSPFALIITSKKMAIFLNILICVFHKWKRLTPCRSLWKKKLLKLEAD